MANKITLANLNPSNFIDSFSRYSGLNILYYGEQNFITFETYKRPKVKSTGDDRSYVITKGTEYRPDLVANKAYGNVEWWWRILEANNMMDIWDFKAGTTITIPSVLMQGV